MLDPVSSSQRHDEGSLSVQTAVPQFGHVLVVGNQRLEQFLQFTKLWVSSQPTGQVSGPSRLLWLFNQCKGRLLEISSEPPFDCAVIWSICQPNSACSPYCSRFMSAPQSSVRQTFGSAFWIA